MSTLIRPSSRPRNPCFSSGPCAKRPGWPPAVLDGPHGFNPQLIGDDYDLSVLNDWSEPLILKTSIKLFGCSYYIHTALEAFKVLLPDNPRAAAFVKNREEVLAKLRGAGGGE